MLKPFFILLLLAPALSYAWVCPNNFSQIVPGDTTDQVEAACGKPDSIKKSESGYRGPQEWQYFITVTQPLNGSGVSAQAAPTVKMSVTLVDQKVINITVQGTSLASTSLCGPTINVGDSKDSVENNCGKPTFVQKQDTDNNSDAKSIEILEYKYNTTAPNTLIFEDGILKSRK